MAEQKTPNWEKIARQIAVDAAQTIAGVGDDEKAIQTYAHTTIESYCEDPDFLTVNTHAGLVEVKRAVEDFLGDELCGGYEKPTWGKRSVETLQAALAQAGEVA